MKHIYEVNPVECQPQWEETPEPVKGRGSEFYFDVACFSMVPVLALDFAYVLWLLLIAFVS